MTNRRQRGFTLVELIIVIIVISILAAIISIAYTSVQKEARDTKNVDGMHKFADAIELFISKNQHFPKGNWGSSAPIGTGTECIDGGNGFAGHGMYKCTIEDTLVASGYLPSGFTVNLSRNTKYPYADGRAALMVYNVGTTKAMVMTSMENPSSQDAANFSAELVKCYGSDPGSGYSPRGYNMSNGICITFSTP